MYTLGFETCLDKIFPSVAADLKFSYWEWNVTVLLNIQR
uniref:Uncharacterized protein n=1 Tax=Arundo donax TaxID=35708 RepID=A0A0A9EHV4_ARUDO